MQYRARLEDFDFDMTIQRFSMSATPGDGMRPFFSSQAAKTKGSYNLAGIANPAIDALIEKIIGADNRARSDGRLPRLRPRVPRRPLLGAAMVSYQPPARLLGPCSIIPQKLPRYQIATMRRRRRADPVVVDPAKAAKLEQAK